MGKTSVLRRLLSVEVVGGAVFGAALPYGVAFAIEVAPKRVPLGLVVSSIVGCAIVGWAALYAIRRYWRRTGARKEADERQERERREQAERLADLERAVAAIACRRRRLSFLPPPFGHRRP